MKVFFRSMKGSVQIFLILIFVSIFFFNAVLIEYARIMVAKRQVEAITRVALRSVLSTYDMELRENYGLFGIDTEEGSKELFYEMLDMNFNSEEGDFNFVTLKVDKEESSIVGKEDLANHNVFKQQILEEMKYRAPIELTVELIDKLGSMSSVMNEASELTSYLDELNQEYEKRDKHFAAMIDNLKYAAKLVKHHNHYLEELKSMTTDDLNLVMKIQSDYESGLAAHNKRLRVAKEELELTEISNTKIQRLVNEYKARAEIDSSDAKELRSIGDNISSDMVYRKDLFQDYYQDIANQEKAYQDIAAAIETLTDKALKMIKAYSKQAIKVEDSEGKENKPKGEDKEGHSIPIGDKLLQEIKAVEDVNKRYNQRYLDSNNELSQKEKESLAMDKKTSKEFRKKKEKEANADLQEMKDLFDLMKDVKGKSEEMGRLHDHYQKYAILNQVIDNEEAKDNSDSSIRVAKDSLSQMSDMFSSMGKLLEELRNEQYLNEYSLSHFSSFDIETLQDLIGIKGNIQFKKEDIVNLLDVQNQQIEYLIYGSNGLGANLSSALRDIFLIRLAVNTTEAFFDPKIRGLGNPLAILIAAIAIGVSEAINDLYKLINGQEVLFSEKFARIPFHYRDYLRILLLLHHGEKAKLTRMQAMIEFMTGARLEEINTFVEGEVAAGIELWFLPGIFKSLSYVGVINGTVEGKTYKISKNVGAFY